jgi:hypothetical protein
MNSVTKVVLNTIGAAAWMVISHVQFDHLLSAETASAVVSGILLALFNLLQEKPKV